MTIYIAYADADRAAAHDLERFLERRGWFVELADGAGETKHLQAADGVVVLWSKNLMLSANRERIEALSASAREHDKLLLTRLDLCFRSAALEEAPAIDALIEGQRDIAWSAIAKRLEGSPKSAAPSLALPQRATPWLRVSIIALLLTSAGAALVASALGLLVLPGEAAFLRSPWGQALGGALLTTAAALIATLMLPDRPQEGA
jgi:hypothetical protein